MKITHAEDYYDKIKERFPDLEMWEIDKIIKHGMQSFFTLNSYGADVMIKDNSFSLYFGKMYSNSYLMKKYYTIKTRIKLRMKYLHKKPIWNGYYYFGLTEEDYQKYIPKKKGRIKNKITFDKLTAWKIEEEAYLYWPAKYFFRLKIDKESGLTFYKENYSTRNIELIAIRDNLGKIQYINE